MGIPVRHTSQGWLAALLVVLMGISCDLTRGEAQQPGGDAPGTEVLTRGPVHEAFAGMVTFNPEPGVVVTKAPPGVIEEMPPDVRPEGDNVTWIPGYWAWDDERNDFLWVSGTWRALPPGRAWIAGYWGQVQQGYQWTSGYWADETAPETTYLPAPPPTVEVGPNIEAPSMDYGWTPGCWLWYQGRYAWSPGYWAQGRADWDWIPSHYVWTHRGYIFVGGYWDYSVERRGVLFAPVYFESGVYARRGYFYSPTIVISLGVFNDHLFLRPRYNHYYFGDYYAPSYYQGGFYASFSFQSGRYGYDPIYSHQRWEHRQDRGWENRVEASYHNLRDHESSRPPRTWAAQRNFNPGPAGRPNRELMAAPIEQLARRTDGPMKFQPVAKAERQKLAQRGQEVQQSRDQRRTLEARPADMTARTTGAALEPVKVRRPQSPIVAKQASQLGRNQAPPQVQQAPKSDPKFQPNSGPFGPQPGVNRNTPQTEPRQLEPEKRSAPGRSEAVPRDRPVQPPPQTQPRESGVKAPVLEKNTPPQPRTIESQPNSAPVRGTVVPRDRQTVGVPAPSQDQKPAAAHRSIAPASRSYETQRGTRKSIPAASEFKPAVRQPAQPQAGNQAVKPGNPARPTDQNMQAPARGNPAAGERNGLNPADKDRENKGRE